MKITKIAKSNSNSVSIFNYWKIHWCQHTNKNAKTILTYIIFSNILYVWVAEWQKVYECVTERERGERERGEREKTRASICCPLVKLFTGARLRTGWRQEPGAPLQSSCGQKGSRSSACLLLPTPARYQGAGFETRKLALEPLLQYEKLVSLVTALHAYHNIRKVRINKRIRT